MSSAMTTMSPACYGYGHLVKHWSAIGQLQVLTESVQYALDLLLLQYYE